MSDRYFPWDLWKVLARACEKEREEAERIRKNPDAVTGGGSGGGGDCNCERCREERDNPPDDIGCNL